MREDIAVIPGLHDHVVAGVGPAQDGVDAGVGGDPELVALTLGPAYCTDIINDCNIAVDNSGE